MWLAEPRHAWWSACHPTHGVLQLWPDLGSLGIFAQWTFKEDHSWRDAAGSDLRRVVYPLVGRTAKQ